MLGIIFILQYLSLKLLPLMQTLHVPLVTLVTGCGVACLSEFCRCRNQTVKLQSALPRAALQTLLCKQHFSLLVWDSWQK